MHAFGHGGLAASVYFIIILARTQDHDSWRMYVQRHCHYIFSDTLKDSCQQRGLTSAKCVEWKTHLRAHAYIKRQTDRQTIHRFTHTHKYAGSSSCITWWMHTYTCTHTCKHTHACAGVGGLSGRCHVRAPSHLRHLQPRKAPPSCNQMGRQMSARILQVFHHVMFVTFERKHPPRTHRQSIRIFQTWLLRTTALYRCIVSHIHTCIYSCFGAFVHVHDIAEYKFRLELETTYRERWWCVQARREGKGAGAARLPAVQSWYNFHVRLPDRFHKVHSDAYIFCPWHIATWGRPAFANLSDINFWKKQM
jgi:hypothetical protein